MAISKSPKNTSDNPLQSTKTEITKSVDSPNQTDQSDQKGFLEIIPDDAASNSSTIASHTHKHNKFCSSDIFLPSASGRPPLTAHERNLNSNRNAQIVTYLITFVGVVFIHFYFYFASWISLPLVEEVDSDLR